MKFRVLIRNCLFFNKHRKNKKKDYDSNQFLSLFFISSKRGSVNKEYASSLTQPKPVLNFKGGKGNKLLYNSY